MPRPEEWSPSLDGAERQEKKREEGPQTRGTRGSPGTGRGPARLSKENETLTRDHGASSLRKMSVLFS